MLGLLLSILLINLLRGESGKSIINVKRCSIEFWLLSALIPVVVGIFAFFTLKKLRNELKYKEEIGYVQDTKDL